MKARKRFGQHFLTDDYCLQSMATAIAPKTDDHLVEIGPGQGALTEYLTDQSKQLDLIELDRDLIPLLEKKFQNKVTIHQCDVLEFDLHQLYHDQKLRVVGNLPYNISTPLLFHLFSQLELIEDMHFLLQKEVVDRLVAKPGSKNYARLSVMSQFYCQATAIIEVPPTAFDPPPKVESTFVRLAPHKEPHKVNSHEQLEAIVREAFSYRRKTLSNSLKRWISADQLAALNIDPKRRPQELTVEEYIRISDALPVQ
ncbi:MAG: 16S rRNA (adenine(1518)-N(6)/adenine(1519)-N(6))-dimethyltransferase RsmA [Coxiellaceae bacterium]|nr:16S rRNA (adenine(1518)-N(6)/adenine(1519)-N(6))-dimethyltransferase RsmA [Coxiellaceae bacterium]